MAAAGGTGIAAVGCGGGCLGIFLILIGIPLLFLWGVGLIPIILGFVLISAGGSAAAAGATVASSGAGMSANANMASQAAQNAPKQCPTCRNTGVIPANSPGAVHYYQTVPAYQNEAQRVAHEVLSLLPQVIDETPKLSGGCPEDRTS